MARSARSTVLRRTGGALQPWRMHIPATSHWQRGCAGLPKDEHAEPTKLQLQRHAVQSAIPMMGFGIVDCVVMTQVGSTIDATLGSALGITSMTAAAIGLFCSDSCGVIFGGTIEQFVGKIGLPTANLTAAQMEMSRTKNIGTLGRLLGIQIGVCIGSISLLFAPEKEK